MMALKREVLDETGLTIGNISSIAHVESEVVTSGKYTGRLYVALFYIAQRLGGELILSDMHSDASWEDPRRIATRALTFEGRRAIQSLHGLKMIQFLVNYDANILQLSFKRFTHWEEFVCDFF